MNGRLNQLTQFITALFSALLLSTTCYATNADIESNKTYNTASGCMSCHQMETMGMDQPLKKSSHNKSLKKHD